MYTVPTVGSPRTSGNRSDYALEHRKFTRFSESGEGLACTRETCLTSGIYSWSERSSLPDSLWPVGAGYQIERNVPPPVPMVSILLGAAGHSHSELCARPYLILATD